MNITVRRIAVGVSLIAAPLLIALGTASASSADPHRNNNGYLYLPEEHTAFPNQTNAPQPGTQIHHSHQNNK
ncbi:hypothetical protein BH09ACT8_BH09ACT8_60250 [soil metagenome]